MRISPWSNAGGVWVTHLGRSAGISGLKAVLCHTCPGWKPPGGVTMSEAEAAAADPRPSRCDPSPPGAAAGVACCVASCWSTSAAGAAGAPACVDKGCPAVGAAASLADDCWVDGRSSLEAEWWPWGVICVSQKGGRGGVLWRTLLVPLSLAAAATACRHSW